MRLIRVTISWPLCPNVTSSVKHTHRNDNEEHRGIGRVVFATLRRYTYKITKHGLYTLLSAAKSRDFSERHSV